MPPTPEIVIRPAGPADLAAVVGIEAVSFPSPWGEDVYLPELRRPETIFLSAVMGAEVAGYVLAWVAYDEAFILKIAVRPDCRRRGVAAALMDALGSEARRRGAASVWLEVRSRNRPAREFYKKRGFVEMGFRKKYYSDTGDDAVTMALNLAPIEQGG